MEAAKKNAHILMKPSFRVIEKYICSFLFSLLKVNCIYYYIVMCVTASGKTTANTDNAVRGGGGAAP